MLLEVNNLNKYYNKTKVLDDISFNLDRGEILGLLGPNGAGKTTTMKIITSNILPTSGDVKIDNESALSNPVSIKQKIGYLAEDNPIYLDMLVIDFLKYNKQFYNRSREIDELASMLDIKNVLFKKVSTLSKGYKQRVGIANALINNPELLILDEPNEGLDPKQRITLRNTIKDLAKDRGIIISTHILEEVKSICDRVVIIDKGKIVADSKISDLIDYNRYEFVYRGQNINKKIKKSIECKEIEFESENRLHKVTIKTDKPIEDHITKLIKDNSLSIHKFVQLDNLEELFNSLKT